MNKRKKTGAGRGRPSTSGDVRIVPIPHEKPDARKLGRAFLALALHQAAQEASAQQEHPSTRREPEEVTDERA